MIERLFEFIGSLGGLPAYAAVGALAAGESSIGVGLVVPGETGMIVGGFVVSQGNATFWIMLTVGIAGAIVGNSIGYEIGRRFGPAVRSSSFGRRIGEDNWNRAEEYLATRGAKAVAYTQFLAVVRSVVPAMAGVSRMPYRKFLFWNALGGIVWASLYTTVGFFAGRSYDRVAAQLEDAGLVVLALFITVVTVVGVARWIARNPERVQALADRAAAWRPIAWTRRNFGGPIRFVARRFRVHDPFGLSLTMGLVFLIVAGWVFTVVVSDVAARSDLVSIDSPIVQYFAEHREPWVTSTAEWVTQLGSLTVLLPLLAVVAAGWLVRTGRWGVALFFVLAVAGAVVAIDALKDLVERGRPPTQFAVHDASGLAFPSGHTALATVAFGALAYIHGSVVRWWSVRVAIWAAAVTVMLLVGFSRLYLGVHWLSDVLGGYALGAVWLGIVVTAFGTSTRFHRLYIVGSSDEPSGAGGDQKSRVSSRPP